MQKRGQLGFIEMQFFFYGFLTGLIGGLVLVFLGTKKIIPFQIPAVCGSVIGPSMFKKGQLGAIEAKFFFFGFIFGIILSFVLVYLATHGVIPNFLGWLCPAAVK
jgi:hypothetical protein